MAITIDYTTSPRYTIQVPQADLTPISGSLYELDTDAFRLELKQLEAAAQGMVFQDTHKHNSEVTVAGITYARVVEVLNASNSSQTDIYQVLFTPDTTYSVRLAGSNNNIFDLQNLILANTVTQVIPTNSAGLISAASIPSETVAALKAETFDGETFEVVLNRLKSWGYGKFVESSAGVFDYYDNAGAVKLFTLTVTEDGLGLVTRERS